MLYNGNEVFLLCKCWAGSTNNTKPNVGFTCCVLPLPFSELSAYNRCFIEWLPLITQPTSTFTPSPLKKKKLSLTKHQPPTLLPLRFMDVSIRELFSRQSDLKRSMIPQDFSLRDLFLISLARRSSSQTVDTDGCETTHPIVSKWEHSGRWRKLQ